MWSKSTKKSGLGLTIMKAPIKIELHICIYNLRIALSLTVKVI